MSTKIQLRRDTASAWTSANPTLSAGEIGYETDTRNIKIGDGTTAWTTLKYQAPYYTAANSGAPNTLLSLDITNSRVGIGTTVPAKALGVVGDIYVGNQTNSGTDGTLGLISSGGANYIQSGQNINASSAPLIIGAIGGGTNWLRVTSSGVGIGVTASPSNTLNIESATPTIRLKDTTNANTAHCLIDANGDNGSVVIAADPTAQGAADSTVSLSVDNTTRLQATTTGVAVTGTLSADNGLSISAGTVTFQSGAVAGAAIATGGITATQLASDAVTTAKILNANVTRAKLAAIPKITIQTYYSGTGNFTVPAGVTSLKVTAVGGGGGGGSANPGGAGGAGTCATAIYTVTAGTAYAYSVGAGGAGATSGSSNATGTAGAATTFLSMSAGGGTAGAATVAGSTGTYALSAAPGGTTILADYRPGLQGISTVNRPRATGASSGLVFVPGATYPPGTGGTGASANGGTDAAGTAASGGVGGMLVIEYIDMA